MGWVAKDLLPAERVSFIGRGSFAPTHHPLRMTVWESRGLPLLIRMRRPASIRTKAIRHAIGARYGLLAAGLTHVAFMVFFLFSMPDALDWYTLRASIPALFLLAIAIWAFRTSLGGQRAFAGSLDD